jgi:hypothetical protein
MQFKPSLIGEAAAIAREHEALLVRLPATVQAFILVELQKWATLFEPERTYQKTLLAHLATFDASDLKHATAGIGRVESDAGCDRIARGDPARFQEESQALLRKRRLLQPWRQEVDAFFQRINPELEARLHPADGPRRLVVQLYGSGVAVQAGNVWSRFKGTGIRIPLALDGAQGSSAFLGALAPGLLAPLKGSSERNPFDAWIIEAHESLNDLVGTSLTGLSYDRLRGYREELTRALYQKIQSGVESPQAFAAYARSLKIAPGSDVLLRSPEQLQAFVRDVFLTGNGTLFVNNTFVEWAAVQALRRAQPRLLVTRFGVRDKLKPFSSLLLFSQPRATDQIPLIEDPVGSFVDVEQLSYYVWLNAEKNAAYRGKTLYLFLAEGFEEMLAIRSDATESGERRITPVTLADVCATMAQWLGAPLPESAGTAIAPLIA